MSLSVGGATGLQKIIRCKCFLLLLLCLKIRINWWRRWWWNRLWWSRWLKQRHTWASTSMNMQSLSTVMKHVWPCLVRNLHVLNHAMLILIKIYELGLHILLHVINAIMHSPRSRLAWPRRSRFYLSSITLNFHHHRIINHSFRCTNLFFLFHLTPALRHNSVIRCGCRNPWMPCSNPWIIECWITKPTSIFMPSIIA